MKNLTTSQPRIEIIETFLSGWANKAETTCLEVLKKGYEIRAKLDERAKELNTSTYVELRADTKFRELAAEHIAYWEAQPKYLRQFSSTIWKWAAPKVKEIIEKEVESKRSKLYNEVTKKVGIVVDAKGLSVGSDGSINGLIIGETGTARITTIMAGGYNIQCLHYRLLIKVIK